MPTSSTTTQPIPISRSGSVGSVSSVETTGPGYFNLPHKNNRPEWIKSYNTYSRKFGKAQANAMYPGVKNWVTAEKFAGRSGNTSGSARKSRRKTRRNLKRK
jgi:hypothetical protein